MVSKTSHGEHQGRAGGERGGPPHPPLILPLVLDARQALLPLALLAPLGKRIFLSRFFG